MFEFIRTHQRLMQLALLLFIFPSFAFVGIQSYAHFGDADDTVAKVGGQTISLQEWQSAQQEQMEQFRQRFGSQFDPKLFDTPEAKRRILDNLVSQRVLGIEAARDHLSVSDKALQESILAISGLTNAEGKFDGDRYRSLLAAQGMTPAMYEARLRQDLALQQLNASIQSTGFAPKTVANRLSELNDQERQIQELSFKAASFISQVKPTDDMLKRYYNENIRQFETAEQVSAEYVVLDSSVLASQVNVSDADIKSYYDQNAKRYTVDEQRRASHILIAVKKDASAAEITAAKAKATGLLEQVKTNPASFAKLAKENSDDSGSGEKGGDLDVFGRGMMVKPFEDAVFKMKLGELSNLVRSDFGFHIIKVTEIKPAAVKTLDEVKPEIAAEIKKQLAAKKYAEAAEIFTNTAYEQGDSLKGVADRLKLKIETAKGLKRVPDTNVGPEVLVNNLKFLNALFSNDVLKNKHNTEAVEVAPNTLIVGRVTEYKPVARKSFEEVQPIVRQKVLEVEAEKLARKSGEAKLASLKTKDDLTGFSQSQVVSRTKNVDVNPAELAAIMRADTAKLPTFVGVEVQGLGYNVIRINKVSSPVMLDAARRQTEQQQIANVLAQQEMLAYTDVLKQKAKVKITIPTDDKSRKINE